MTVRMAIIALALSVSPALVLADNPSDQPLTDAGDAFAVVNQSSDAHHGRKNQKPAKEAAASTSKPKDGPRAQSSNAARDQQPVVGSIR